MALSGISVDTTAFGGKADMAQRDVVTLDQRDTAFRYPLSLFTPPSGPAHLRASPGIGATTNEETPTSEIRYVANQPPQPLPRKIDLAKSAIPPSARAKRRMAGKRRN